jgi:hypothetical protein
MVSPIRWHQLSQLNDLPWAPRRRSHAAPASIAVSTVAHREVAYRIDNSANSSMVANQHLGIIDLCVQLAHRRAVANVRDGAERQVGKHVPG